jgi:hypothetical protein
LFFPVGLLGFSVRAIDDRRKGLAGCRVSDRVGGVGVSVAYAIVLVMEGAAARVVPVRFGDVDVLVAATPVVRVGSEPTSAASRVVVAYERAEAAVLGVAASVAETVGRLVERGGAPRQVQVEFGLSVSLEGDVLVVKGTTEATLAVTLIYDVAG